MDIKLLSKLELTQLINDASTLLLKHEKPPEIKPLQVSIFVQDVAEFLCEHAMPMHETKEPSTCNEVYTAFHKTCDYPTSILLFGRAMSTILGKNCTKIVRRNGKARRVYKNLKLKVDSKT